MYVVTCGCVYLVLTCNESLCGSAIHIYNTCHDPCNLESACYVDTIAIYSYSVRVQCSYDATTGSNHVDLILMQAIGMCI